MILGIGIDQCEVRRLSRQLESPADEFIAAVFRPGEIAYCTAKHSPAEHFAARFAAKEAVLKALAGAGGEGTFWQDILISNEPSGRPQVALDGRLRVLADRLGVRKIHGSLTHTAELAAAVAIAEG